MVALMIVILFQGLVNGLVDLRWLDLQTTVPVAGHGIVVPVYVMLLLIPAGGLTGWAAAYISKVMIKEGTR